MGLLKTTQVWSKEKVTRRTIFGDHSDVKPLLKQVVRYGIRGSVFKGNHGGRRLAPSHNRNLLDFETREADLKDMLRLLLADKAGFREKRGDHDWGIKPQTLNKRGKTRDNSL